MKEITVGKRNHKYVIKYIPEQGMGIEVHKGDLEEALDVFMKEAPVQLPQEFKINNSAKIESDYVRSVFEKNGFREI